uniref:Uncharacterized protein n=1 Tax=Meloidogyne enterolobii TaxID=390850 RepID=A0A6V7V2W7_MELEN|nr:unnamed protein product [Meloidogyne enterolobii]
MCSDLMRRRRSRLARSCRRYRERRTPSLTAKYTNWSTGKKHPTFLVLVFILILVIQVNKETHINNDSGMDN